MNKKKRVKVPITCVGAPGCENSNRSYFMLVRNANNTDDKGSTAKSHRRWSGPGR